jgi:hypothetical protein
VREGGHLHSDMRFSACAAARARAGVTIRYCLLANRSERKHGIGHISGGFAEVTVKVIGQPLAVKTTL